MLLLFSKCLSLFRLFRCVNAFFLCLLDSEIVTVLLFHVVCLQRRLCNFVEKSLVENVLPILLVAFNCKLTQLLDQCTERVARSDLYRFCIEKEVPLEVAEKIKQIRLKSPQEEEETTPKDFLLLVGNSLTNPLVLDSYSSSSSSTICARL